MKTYSSSVSHYQTKRRKTRKEKRETVEKKKKKTLFTIQTRKKTDVITGLTERPVELLIFEKKSITK